MYRTAGLALGRRDRGFCLTEGEQWPAGGDGVRVASGVGGAVAMLSVERGHPDAALGHGPGKEAVVPFWRTVQITVQEAATRQKERDLHCCKSLSDLW